MSILPFNITNPGIYISGLLTAIEQTYVTNLVLAGASASEDDVLTWKSGAPSWEAPTAAAGDMTKAVYDINDNGITDSSEKELVSFINKTGSSLAKGTVVYLNTTSSSATHPEALKANASTETTSSKTIGAVFEDTANDATGYIVTSGEVSNLDTSTYSIGDRLWLSTTDGLVTTTRPSAPNHAVFIGTVTRAQSTNGRILYAIQNGYEVDELHDVSFTSLANDDFFQRKAGVWVNRTIAQIKTDLAINNVNNTSDADKPISTATQTALNTKLDASQKGANNGVAELDAGGKVPSAQLPSFVDDVVEVANFAALPVTGETGKIYVTLDNNLTYRWSGSAYVEISASLALGETSATAYRGDRGKTAYDYSQIGHVPLTGGTMTGDLIVPDEAYDATSWNENNEVPTKNAIRDKIESLTSGSGITRSVTVTSGNVTAGSSASIDYVYFVAGAHTISLPAASGNTNLYIIKNNHTANITVDTVGSETIDGTASISVAPEESVQIMSNGTNFNIV